MSSQQIAGSLVANVAVLGGGIAGLSVAAALSNRVPVVVMEKEDMLAMHSSGRSVALYDPTYGPPVMRALTAASYAIYADAARPGPAWTSPLGSLYVATADQTDSLADLMRRSGGDEFAVQLLRPDELYRRVPALRPGLFVGAAYQPVALSIDTAAVLDFYRRTILRNGGRILLSSAPISIERGGGHWRLRTKEHQVACETILNASGAWADEVARQISTPPIGIEPRKRTAAMCTVDRLDLVANAPFVFDIDEQWYFRRETGGIILSPADETPTPPCDAQSDEYDVAVAVDRVQKATSLEVKRVIRSWAGLRSFAPDNELVTGRDPAIDGMAWHVGLGGFGFQTAPAAAELCAGLLLDGSVPSRLAAYGITANSVTVSRLKPSIAA